MNTNTNGDYRYPGSRPFYDTDVDRCLFFGRNREKESLLHKVLSANLVVLYAKSGLGKTSLINAGLNQALRERGFIPLPVRLNNPDLDPLKEFYEEIEDFVKQNKLDYEEGEKASLWQYFKTAAFWSADDTLLKPVLILDQFEEFFDLHSLERRKNFIRQLADIVNNNIPKELWESIPGGEPFPYSEKPPNVKVIISIREDYLGQLEEMSREIPDILHRRFRLLGLSREQARQAIIEPSQVQYEAIRAASFKYSAETVDMMLDFLCKRKERTGIKKTDEVESFQLQLLCRHIEDKVRERAGKESGDIIVKRDDLGGEVGMQRVLQRFYDDQVGRLGSVFKRRRARRLCEKGLISSADRRLSLEEDEIKRNFGVTGNLLAELVNSRLLRSEPRVGSIYYELSHDTLVAPIRESQKKRNFKRNTMGGIIAVCISIAMILFTLIYLMNTEIVINKLSKEAVELKKEQKYEEAIEKYRAILQIDKTYSKAYLALGQLHVERKEFDQAIKTYKQGINENIKSPDIYRELAVLYIKNKEPDEAIELYQQALKVNPENALLYLDLGHYYYELEKYDKAIQNFREAIKRDPRSADAYNGLGYALNYRGKKSEEAIDAFEKAVKLNPKYAEAYNGLGRALYPRGKKPKEAIDAFEKAVKLNPKYADAYNGLGNVFFSFQNYKEAVKAYLKVTDIEPDYPEAYVDLGNALKSLKKYKEAIDAYKTAIELNPRCANAYYGWGNVLNYHYRKYNEAIKKYQKAVELDPGNFYAHNELGIALRKQKRYTRAIEVCQKAIEINPEYAEAYYNMGIALQKKRKYQEAINAYRKAIKLKPGRANFHAELGNALFSQEEYEEAIKAYKEAIKINPNKYAYVYKNMGKAYTKLGKPNEAEKAFRKASEIRLDADTYFNMGDANLEQGEYDEAVDAYEKGIRLQPGNAHIYSNLGYAFSELKRYNEAINAYKEADKLEPGNVDVYSALGYAFSELKRYNEALEAYKKAVKIQPLDAELHYRMGNTFRKQEKYDKAVDAYNEAVRIQPDYADAYYGLGVALSYRKKYKDAIDAYKEAFEIDPGHSLAYKKIINILSDPGKYNEVIKAYKKVLRNAPGNIAIKTDLAEIYLLGKKFKSASKHANKVLKKNNISTEYKLALRFVSISSQLFLEKKKKAFTQLKALIQDYRSLPGDYDRDWNFSTIKKFISDSKLLPPKETDLLLQFIDILESPKAEGVKKLNKLIAANPGIIR